MNFDSISEAHAKVMGPGEDLSPSNILVPPRLRPDTDKLQWREAVYEWAETLQACANGGDSRAKGAAATLGMRLYRSLEFSKKELVKKAVRTGELVLTPKAGNDSVNQMSVIKKILNLVAKDSTVDRLRRIVRLYKEVTYCKRKPGESISAYIERFAGPALSYLNLTKSEQDSSDSQNFAIILLLNARLSTQTFTNIISNLVVSAKGRGERDTSIISLTKERMSTIRNIITAAKDGPLNDSNKVACTLSVTAIDAALVQHEKVYDSEDACAWIGLQDAICALEEAGLEEKDLDEVQHDKQASEPSSKAYLNSNKYNQKKRKRKRDFETNKFSNRANDPKQDGEDEKKKEGVRENAPENKNNGFTKFKRGRYEKTPKDKKKEFFQ